MSGWTGSLILSVLIFYIMPDQVERDTRKGIAYLKVMVEDKCIGTDKLFPKYVRPESMPLVGGCDELRKVVAIWKQLKLNGDEPTYDKILEVAKTKFDSLSIEIIEAVIAESKKLSLTNKNLSYIRDELKKTELRSRLTLLFKDHPLYFSAYDLNITSEVEMMKFFDDFDRMEDFFSQLTYYKDKTERITNVISDIKDLYDYGI